MLLLGLALRPGRGRGDVSGGPRLGVVRRGSLGSGDGVRQGAADRSWSTCRAWDLRSLVEVARSAVSDGLQERGAELSLIGAGVWPDVADGDAGELEEGLRAPEAVPQGQEVRQHQADGGVLLCEALGHLADERGHGVAPKPGAVAHQHPVLELDVARPPDVGGASGRARWATHDAPIHRSHRGSRAEPRPRARPRPRGCLDLVGHSHRRPRSCSSSRSHGCPSVLEAQH
mmetsp:Transcript_112984/g.326448  ORF Transcript_112984/g.326448 Transcript_112984/m.326448 type:complete len:230 (+) Transcript_112984:896-1585(+)